MGTSAYVNLRRFFTWLVLFALVVNAGRAEQVVISEIMYHPARGLPAWVELYNQTATPLDMANWRLTGEAMEFVFPDFSSADPPASFLRPFERIVISATNASSLRAGFSVPASVRVLGSWQGALKHRTDRLTLKDKNGVTLCTVKYRDRGQWSPAADGAGHSLVLKNPDRAVDDWRNWTVSLFPGGTPGTAPGATGGTPVANPEITASQRVTRVNFGDRWRYWSNRDFPGVTWCQSDFDDTAWPEGPGLFGFEDAPLPAPGLRTPFNFSNQITYYFRKKFVFDGYVSGLVLTLDQVADDGAVYYLNGNEIGRSRMPEGVIGPNTSAVQNISDAIEELDVFPINSRALVKGTNVLAAEVHQSTPRSTDLVFGARLNIAVQGQGSVVINKVFPDPAGQGYAEFYNPGTNAVNLRGYHLSDEPQLLAKHQVTRDLLVPAKGVAALTFAEAGLRPAAALKLFLAAPDGKTLVNGLTAEIPAAGLALARQPAGSKAWFLMPEQLGDAARQNIAALTGALHLNEVHFSGAKADWVELYNSGTSSLALDGLFLSARRDFSDRVPLSGQLASKSHKSLDVDLPLKSGEVTLYLVNAASTVLDCRVFEQPRYGDTFQAFPDGSQEWYGATTSTRGSANNPARNTDVVINEIMCDPPHGQEGGQFVELFNRGEAEVDLTGWQFTEGIDFQFPDGATIPAGGYLVVAANTNWMVKAYAQLPMVGNFSGKLSARGELLRLVDARGNLVNEVDYRLGGDWPELAKGGGSSLELINSRMDNRLSSAWRDSDESQKSGFRRYSTVALYQELTTFGSKSDYRELHLHLVGDGHLVVEKIALQRGIGGRNEIRNGDVLSKSGSSADGWLAQGNHASSFMTNGLLHLIAEGHGDNRANRVEIDGPGLTPGEAYQLVFNARWVSGSPRLIAQTFDHSLAHSFLIDIPDYLGTPGALNSRATDEPAPQVDSLRHYPPVPTPTDTVKISARIFSAVPLVSVQVFHRLDRATGDSRWKPQPMFDDGTHADEAAGDGIYTAELADYKRNGQIAQFYVRAETKNGQAEVLPRHGADKPALFMVDGRVLPRDLRTVRFIVSAFDLEAVSDGETPKYGFRYPRLSNKYFNATFISNEQEIFYNAEIRNSGSPWTRHPGIDRSKWKLPDDRLFRSHQKFTFDNDPDGRARHYNRFARYLLYLLGHSANENEFIRVVINDGAISLREDTEPVDADFLNRNFSNGNQGDLYRIDDEWWFTDGWEQMNRDADWSYKASDSAGRYWTEWMKRSNEVADDFSRLIEFFKLVSGGQYTQAEIERYLDPHAVLKMAVVRGYISDWDSFTLHRGKNSYFYRRPTDGRFQFFHWDSDLAFRDPNSRFSTGPVQFRRWLDQPYNRRIFYGYLAELIQNYARNSPRMEAWLQAEQSANPACRINASLFRNWFTLREAAALREMGSNFRLTFAITTNGGQPITTANETITLAGVAPYGVMNVTVAGQPEARCAWSNATTWSIANLKLQNGENVLSVNGADQWGKVLCREKIAVTRSAGEDRKQ